MLLQASRAAVRTRHTRCALKCMKTASLAAGASSKAPTQSCQVKEAGLSVLTHAGINSELVLDHLLRAVRSLAEYPSVAWMMDPMSRERNECG